MWNKIKWNEKSEFLLRVFLTCCQTDLLNVNKPQLDLTFDSLNLSMRWRPCLAEVRLASESLVARHDI